MVAWPAEPIDNDEPSVLITDDSQSWRSVVEEVLARSGFRTRQAACGEEAIELVRTEWIDIVLIDFHMPRLDGISATSRIRAVDPSARVIVICGPCSHEQSREALAAGAAACIRRPLDRHRFAEQVNAGLRDIG